MDKIHYTKDNDFPIEGEYLYSKPLLAFISLKGNYHAYRAEVDRYFFGDFEDKQEGFKDFLRNDTEIVRAWVDISDYVDEYNKYAKKEEAEALERMKKK